MNRLAMHHEQQLAHPEGYREVSTFSGQAAFFESESSTIMERVSEKDKTGRCVHNISLLGASAL
jgi:hypothetical protein